jgi:ribonuclease-3
VTAPFEREVEDKIGVSFKHLDTLRLAFVHRSYINEFPQEGTESNERLEFFGDSVLSYVVAERLFRDNPHIDEGALTEWRGYLVKRDSLAMFARRLDLGKHLLLGHGEESAGGRNRSANLACLFEAVVGAIAIDRGLTEARRFILRAIGDEINLRGRPTPIDPKSRLQEVVQARWQRPPSYHTIHEEGPEHKKLFTVQVSVQGNPLGTGTGPSKQEAEREAARQALTDLLGVPQAPEPAVALEPRRGARKRLPAPKAGQTTAPRPSRASGRVRVAKADGASEANGAASPTAKAARRRATAAAAKDGA